MVVTRQACLRTRLLDLVILMESVGLFASWHTMNASGVPQTNQKKTDTEEIMEIVRKSDYEE